MNQKSFTTPLLAVLLGFDAVSQSYRRYDYWYAPSLLRF